MDDRRFDDVARAIGHSASPTTRRRALLGALGVGAAGFAAIFRAKGGSGAATQPLCANEGEPCTIWGGCCGELTCVGNAVNPNNGVCVAGVAPRVAEQPAPARRRASSRGSGTDSGESGAGSNETATATATPPGDDASGDRRATKTPEPTEVAEPTKTPQATRVPKTPKPKKADRVTITLDCEGPAEQIGIRNNTDERIELRVLQTLDPLPAVGDPEPWVFDEAGEAQVFIEAGETYVRTAGPSSDGDTLSLVASKIFSSSNREGVRIQTSIGSFHQLCRPKNEKRDGRDRKADTNRKRRKR